MQYTIRVELHDADWSHYVVLAQQLAARGITDVITADNGVRYTMPPAEYNYTGAADLQTVLNMAKAAANATGKRSAVLVTQSAGRMWDGLEKAK